VVNADLVTAGLHEFALTRTRGEVISRQGLAYGEIVELAVPLADLGLAPGDVVSFQVRLSRDGIERECSPEKVPIEFVLVTNEFALRNWMV
jgi:hypothetical protein